jgi:hypothetical protein
MHVMLAIIRVNEAFVGKVTEKASPQWVQKERHAPTCPLMLPVHETMHSC